MFSTQRFCSAETFFFSIGIRIPKFFAAVAADNITGTHVGLDQLADRFKHLVAGGMTEAIVTDLK